MSPLRKPAVHHFPALLPTTHIVRAFHKGPSSPRFPKHQNPHKPFQKKPFQRPQVSLPRYTARCIFWSDEGCHGFFRELIDGWQCIAYESDLVDLPQSGIHVPKWLPRRGDVVEFSLMNDLPSQRNQQERTSQKKFKSLRMINVTCPGSVPLSKK